MQSSFLDAVASLTKQLALHNFALHFQSSFGEHIGLAVMLYTQMLIQAGAQSILGCS